MSWKRAMRLNKPESCYIAFGCFGALVCGAVQPAFAIAFAEMLGVSRSSHTYTVQCTHTFRL